MTEPEIRQVEYSPALFAPILADAAGDDANFLVRLEREWIDGTMRFDGEGEILLGLLVDGRLVGVGGISHDPYAPAERLGRVRHLYVLRNCRRRGLGRALIRRLVAHSRDHFSTLRLTAERREAVELYESLGFERREGTKQTHVLHF